MIKNQITKLREFYRRNYFARIYYNNSTEINMEPDISYSRKLLKLTGAAAHFSDDSDFQIAYQSDGWRGKRNNFFVQKRILELEAHHSEELEEKSPNHSSRKMRAAMEKYMNELRAETLKFRIKNHNKHNSKRAILLKSHSLDGHADDEYYFSKKYMNLLTQAKRVVFFPLLIDIFDLTLT